MRESMTSVRRGLASLRYSNPSKGMSVILVAGTYGKTTTATFLKGILTEGGRKAALVPLKYRQTVSGLYAGLARAKKQGYKVAIIEVDDELLMSGALKRMTIDGLVAVNETDQYKLLLALNPQYLVTPTGAAVPAGTVESYQHITVGEDIVADARIESMRLYRKGTELRVVIDHQTKIEIASQFVGQANARNLATAIAAAYVFGVELEVMQEGVADLTPLEGRFEYIETTKDVYYYLDAGGDTKGLGYAVASAKQLTKKRCIVAVSDKHLTSEMIEMAKVSTDRLFVVGYEGDVPSGVEVVDGEKVAIEKATRAARPGDLVLFYGTPFAAKTEGESLVRRHLKENL